MSQDQYNETIARIRLECVHQLDDANLPSALREAIEQRGVLFGEHPGALVALPVLMYQTVGGAGDAEVVAAGAAMEFLLAAADVLDDVQDMALPESAIDGEALHAHYINEIELVTALLLLGEQSMVSLFRGNVPYERATRASAVFNTFKIRSFSGQYQDAHGYIRADSNLATSFQITCGKSGSLGRCSAEIGAALATSDPDLIALAGLYGEHLAVARQFHDDVANLWPVTGQLEDLEQLKSTLPLTFALAKGADGKNKPESDLGTFVHLEELDGREQLHWKDSPVNGHVKAARDEIFSGGAIHFALLQATINLVRARSLGKQIEQLVPGSSMLQQLASM